MATKRPRKVVRKEKKRVKRKELGQPKKQAQAPKARRRAAPGGEKQRCCPTCGRGRVARMPLVPGPVTINSPEPVVQAMQEILAEWLQGSAQPDYQIAKATGLQRQTIGTMRRAEHTPNFASMQMLCRYFGLHLSELVLMAEERCRRAGWGNRPPNLNGGRSATSRCGAVAA